MMKKTTKTQTVQQTLETVTSTEAAQLSLAFVLLPSFNDLFFLA